MRVDAGGDDLSGKFFAVLKGNAASAAILDEDFSYGSFGADFDSCFAGSVGDGVRNCSRAAAAEAPGAECAVDFAHVVMEEDIGGPGRANPKKGADDSGSRHGGFEDVGFEPLVEEIGGAHGHELDESVTLVGGEFAETLEEEVELLEIFRIERGGVGRNHREHGLHEAAHGRHHLREFVVGFGVEAGMTANVADGFRVVVHAPEIIPAGHGGEGAVERQDFQAVAGKVKFANDFRAEKRDDVRTFGKKKAGENLFGDGGAAKDVAAFEDDDLLPCFGKVRGVDQAVVAAADDDNVVVLPHSV
jgi:hypothetical protein